MKGIYKCHEVHLDVDVLVQVPPGGIQDPPRVLRLVQLGIEPGQLDLQLQHLLH